MSDRLDLSALFALLGIANPNIEDPEKFFSGILGDEPSAETLTYAAGRVVAAWYSIHASTIQAVASDPFGGDCRMRVGHPGLGSTPSAHELWDLVHIMLAGTAARMAMHRKFRGRESAEDLALAKGTAERLAACIPFPAVPWQHSARIGTFRIASVFVTKPGLLAAHVLDMSYVHARAVAAARVDAITRIADVLADKKLLLAEDVEEVLGPRMFALHPQS